MIIYLHGFASHGEGNKAKMLREYFPNEEVVSPTLPVNPMEAVDFIEKIYKSRPANERVVFVGTSLGGFYAYYFAALHDAPGAFINPSLEPWITLKDKVGLNKRHDTDEEFEWKEEYLGYLKELYDSIDRTEIYYRFLYFFISLDDEVINHGKIIDLFPREIIKFYDKMGHRFKDFSVLLPEIKKIVEDPYRGDPGEFPDPDL
ncbi:MAG: YqiA/YcfP family alpha/beta fold hydrolase [Acidobacteriota bacterium]